MSMQGGMMLPRLYTNNTGWQCPKCNIQVDPISADTSKCAIGWGYLPSAGGGNECCNCYWDGEDGRTRFLEVACPMTCPHCKLRRTSWGGATTKKKYEQGVCVCVCM